MLVPAIASIGMCMLLEHLEHADVRGAARAAAGQHEADAGPMGRRSRGRAGQFGGVLRDGDGRRGEPQSCEK